MVFKDDEKTLLCMCEIQKLFKLSVVKSLAGIFEVFISYYTFQLIFNGLQLRSLFCQRP